MATEQILRKITGIAAVSFANSQYQFCKLAGTTDKYGPDVTTIAAATDLPIGVAQDTPAAGDELDIAVDGVTKCYIGSGGVTPGQLLTIDASGNAVAATQPTLSDVSGVMDTTSVADAGQYIVGIALYTHAQGDIGTILLRFGGRIPA